MAYGNYNNSGYGNRGFNGGNRFGGNRGGNNRAAGQGGAQSLKEGKGRAFPNTTGKEGGPFAGGNVRVGGKIYRVSLFLNANSKNFNDPNAQAEAVELTQQFIADLSERGMTVGLVVQEPDAQQGRGNQGRSFNRQAPQRPARSYEPPVEEEPEEDEEEAQSVTPWGADEEEIVEEVQEAPKPKTKRTTAAAATTTIVAKPAAKRTTKK